MGRGPSPVLNFTIDRIRRSPPEDPGTTRANNINKRPRRQTPPPGPSNIEFETNLSCTSEDLSEPELL